MQYCTWGSLHPVSSLSPHVSPRMLHLVPSLMSPRQAASSAPRPRAAQASLWNRFPRASTSLRGSAPNGERESLPRERRGSTAPTEGGIFLPGLTPGNNTPLQCMRRRSLCLARVATGHSWMPLEHWRGEQLERARCLPWPGLSHGSPTQGTRRHH